MFEINLSYVRRAVKEYPDSGPGPKTLLAGDEQSGYFGTVPENTLLTALNLKTTYAPTGTDYTLPTGGSRRWNKAFYKGKVIYFPNFPIVNNVSYASLYSKGAVYGEPGFGKYPLSPNVDQMVTINIRDSDDGRVHTFIIRLPKIWSVDPTAPESDSTIVLGDDNEWSSFIKLPIVSANNAIFGEACLGQTSSSNTPATNALYRTRSRTIQWAKASPSNAVNWAPVLELAGLAPTLPNTGPGGAVVRNGNSAYGYMGRVSKTELFTYSEVDAFAGITQGTVVNPAETETDLWGKFIHEGKILFFSIYPLRTDLNWNNVYDKGLVYGEDGPGIYPGTTDVNQKRLITKVTGDGTQYVFMVRTPYVYNDKSPQSIPGDGGNASRWDKSEYSLLERCIPKDTPSTSGQQVWDDYGAAAKVYSSGIVTPQMWLNQRTYFIANQTNKNMGGRAQHLRGDSNKLWYVVLELVEIIKP